MADQLVVVGADEQSAVEVDLDRWVTLAEAALVAEGIEGPAELSLTMVESAVMAELNQTHMGHDGPTDVLSFPLDAAPEHPGLPRLLGDIVICPEVAERNAPDHAGNYVDEMALLTVHGVLHILGHDHAEDDEREVMQARERDLLGRFHRLES